MIKTRFKSWWTSTYDRLPEPRIISVAYGVFYTVTIYTAAAAIIDPPKTVENVANFMMPVMAWTLLAGAIAGLIGIVTTWRETEKYAIWLIGLVQITYGIFLIYIHATEPGNRLFQVDHVTGALLATIVRSYWVYKLIPATNARAWRKGRQLIHQEYEERTKTQENQIIRPSD